MTTPTQLYHLTLTPFPLSSLPPAEELLAEARSIFDHPAWGPAKSWPLGLTTQALPTGAITQSKAEEGVQEKKGGFWGGGKSDAQKESEGSTGIAWHMRTVTMEPEGADYDTFFETLAERHCEQEVEYVETLSKAIEMEPNCYLKLYDLPFPTTNRSFISYVVVHTTTPAPTPSNSTPLRSFVVFSLPAHLPAHEAALAVSEQGHVRGRYVAVEEVREVEVDGKKKVEWKTASRSTPGGSIPGKLAESYMASSMVGNTMSYLTWLQKRTTKEARVA